MFSFFISVGCFSLSLLLLWNLERKYSYSPEEGRGLALEGLAEWIGLEREARENQFHHFEPNLKQALIKN